MPDPRALTIDAYWAWAIAHGSKRVENRTWRTTYRGPLLVHAGRTKTRDIEAIEAIDAIDLDSLATADQVAAIRGHLIAVCDVVDVVEASEREGDPWSFGPWCWVLENVRVLPAPIAAKGQQMLWTPEAEVVRAVLAQLDGTTESTE